jgi:uncharacterized protein (DUF305 family)
MRIRLIAAFLSAVFMSPAFAEDMPMSHSMHGMDAAQPSDAASTKAFKAANDKMHRDMAIPYSGQADVDFVRGMIAHHRGAIDMAQVELKYGTDPEMKALAETIIKAQQPEIDQMQAWLAKHGK